MDYYVGDVAKDASNHRGWIVGAFMEEAPLKTDLVEVKYWTYKKGDTSHPPKTSSIMECTFILSGHATALLGNEVVDLRAGSYLVISPGLVNNALHEIHEDITGMTIKAPSDVTAKKELPRT